MERVKDPALGLFEQIQQVPLRLVVEDQHIEVISEARRDVTDPRVAPHPRAREWLTLGHVDRDVVPTGDQTVAELENAADAAVPLQVRLEETDPHDLTSCGGEAV